MNTSPLLHKRPRARSIALRVVLCYFLAGIFFFLLERLAEMLDLGASLLIFVQDYRGSLLVVFSGGILYLFVRHYLAASERDEETIARMAFYDSQTGLPNRESFREHLEGFLEDGRRHGREVEVSYLDIDRFRTIVRTLGLDAAQCLLGSIADRLKECLGEGEFLAHAGGDEFMLLVSDAGPPEKTEGLASRLLEAVRLPLDYLGHELHLTASVGIALFPHDGDTGATLLKNAYSAMNRAKEMGGDHYQFYFSDLSEYSTSTLLLANRLHKALKEEQFVPHYQPQVRVADGRVVGMEALISWKHPAHPGLTPSEFIPLAEESGLIEPIGEWILRAACRQNRQWQDEGLPSLRVAVNVSARQFYRTDLVELVKGILAETGLEARWLALEITETVLMQDVEETVRTLDGLKEIGVHIIVDDFGIGYSSLNYLKRFPLQTLKLDRSFVSGIPADGDAMAITAAVIAMAHVMNLTVVAEGVEREDQRSYLAARKCDEIQGFLVGRPLSAANFVDYLKKGMGDVGDERGQK